MMKTVVFVCLLVAAVSGLKHPIPLFDEISDAKDGAVAEKPDTSSVEYNSFKSTLLNSKETEVLLQEDVNCKNCSLSVLGVLWKSGAKIFVRLLFKTGLAEMLRLTKGPFTVFAPPDRAFRALPFWVRIYLRIHKAALRDFLLYHMVNENVTSDHLSDDLLIPSLWWKRNIRINIYSNGNKSLATATGSPIIKADLMGRNGVVHVVKKPLYPLPARDSLAGVTSKCPAFKILNKALTVANLTSALNGKGPFTLFAPGDRAFKKLPKGVIDKLMKNATLLTDVLLYHVTNGTYYSTGLYFYPSLRMLSGESVNVTACCKKGVFVNKAKVTFADASVSNGVMHSISRVLIPPSLRSTLEMADDAAETNQETPEVPLTNDILRYIKYGGHEIPSAPTFFSSWRKYLGL